MKPTRRMRLLRILAVAGVLSAVGPLAAASASPAPPTNITGLPTYPNLDTAVMDDLFSTEQFGRWCARFSATTSDSLSAVEDWYRRTLLRASETDLDRDERFKLYPALTGIKLSLGRDYVALYRLANQRTVIELHRCTWAR